MHNKNMTITSVSKWLTQKFLEWQQKAGELKTQLEFAEFLGVKQSTVNSWMNGKRAPEGYNIDLLASKLGSEIYDLMGVRNPYSVPLDQLPPDLRIRLAAAVQEVNSVLSSRALTGSSPEAEDIVIEIFESHGFKYTRTVKE